MDFIDSNGNWMKSKLEEFFCKDDVEIIRRMPTNLKLQDKWIWHFKAGIRFLLILSSESPHPATLVEKIDGKNFGI